MPLENRRRLRQKIPAKDSFFLYNSSSLAHNLSFH